MACYSIDILMLLNIQQWNAVYTQRYAIISLNVFLKRVAGRRIRERGE